MLGAQITLIGAFDQNIDAGLGFDRVHRAQYRVPVALTFVGFLVAPVGSPISAIDPPVAPIRPPVTPIDPPVTPISLPVAPVRRQVPHSTGIAVISGVVALTGRLVARLPGMLSLRRDFAVQVRRQVATLRRLLTLLRPPRTAGPTRSFRIGEGPLHPVRPLGGDPVPLVGDVSALVSRQVTLVRDPAAFVSHAVAFVGGALALAFLGLGSHQASLPRWGGKECRTNPESVPDKPDSGRERVVSLARPLGSKASPVAVVGPSGTRHRVHHPAGPP